jgi:hypothetical protein
MDVVSCTKIMKIFGFFYSVDTWYVCACDTISLAVEPIRITEQHLTMGRVVYGASCPWGELSVGRLSVGRTVRGASCREASCRGTSFDGASFDGASFDGASGP